MCTCPAQRTACDTQEQRQKSYGQRGQAQAGDVAGRMLSCAGEAALAAVVVTSGNSDASRLLRAGLAGSLHVNGMCN